MVITPWDVAGTFRYHTGLRTVKVTGRTAFIVVEDERPGRDYLSVLYGPYEDAENDDVRLYLSYRRLDGYCSIDLLVQDKDDDAFLNSNAEGAEKYRNLRATWKTSQATVLPYPGYQRTLKEPT